MLKIYGLKQCSTARRGKKYLEDHGLDLGEMIDIRKQPPTREELQLALEGVDHQVKKLMNTSGGLYREMDLKNRLDDLSEDEVLDLLAEHGMLVKRPLITDGKKATVGAKEDTLKEVWLS